MFKDTYRRFVLTTLCRLTWSKVVACLVVVCIVIYIYQQPGRPSLTIAGLRPLASFVHRPATLTAVTAYSHGTNIPKIVHQTWKSQSDLPETFRQWMSSWLQHNVDWQYWLWTDDDIRRLMTTAFPRYLAIFDNYPAHAYRVDAFRRDSHLTVGVRW